jgi:hypothetical protein
VALVKWRMGIHYLDASGVIMDSIDYLDFDLRISSSKNNKYSVDLLNSPAGQASGTMHCDVQAIKEQALDITTDAAARQFGSHLFDALINGEVRGRYDVSRTIAESRGAGLRIKLRILSPELVALPWEYMHDSRKAEYVCLSWYTPLVRCMELSQAIPDLTVNLPLKILGMTVSPTNLQMIDISLARATVQKAIDAMPKGLVELTWMEGNTWRDLQRASAAVPGTSSTSSGMVVLIRDRLKGRLL